MAKKKTVVVGAQTLSSILSNRTAKTLDEVLAGTVDVKCIKATQYKSIDVPRLSTGVFPFDYAVGGGFPFNMMSCLYGPPDGGKTTLVFQAMGHLHRICSECLLPTELCKCGGGARKGKIFYCRTEGEFDSGWCSKAGADLEHLRLAFPNDGESACTAAEAAVCASDCSLVIIDSIAGLIPQSELATTYYDFTVATQSALLSRFVKRLVILLTRERVRGHKVAVVFVNQLRDNIGNKYDPEKMPGGWAVKHFCRLIARCSQLSIKSEDRGDDGIANRLHFSVSMNMKTCKVQVQHLARNVEYWFDPDTCRPEDRDSVLEYAKKVGIAKKLLDKSVTIGNDHYINVKDAVDAIIELSPRGYYYRNLIIEKAKQLKRDFGVVSE
jgi:RecA/RadA recombinase